MPQRPSEEFFSLDFWVETNRDRFCEYVLALDRGMETIEVDEIVDEVLKAALQKAPAPKINDPETKNWVYNALRCKCEEFQLRETDPLHLALREQLLAVFDNRNHAGEWTRTFSAGNVNAVRLDESVAATRIAVGKRPYKKGARNLRQNPGRDRLNRWLSAIVSRGAALLGVIDRDEKELKKCIVDAGCPDETKENYFSRARIGVARLTDRYKPGRRKASRPNKKKAAKLGRKKTEGLGHYPSLNEFFRNFTILMKWFDEHESRLKGVIGHKKLNIPSDNVSAVLSLARTSVEDSAISFNPSAELGPWITSTVRNRAIKWARKEYFPISAEGKVETVQPDDILTDGESRTLVGSRSLAVRPDHILRSAEDKEVLAAAREALSDEDAEIIRQHHLEHVPFSAMAVERAEDWPKDSTKREANLKDLQAALRKAHDRVLDKLKALIRFIQKRGTSELKEALAELCNSDRIAVESKPINSDGRKERVNAILRLLDHVDIRQMMGTLDGKLRLHEAATFVRDKCTDMVFWPPEELISDQQRKGRTGATVALLLAFRTYHKFIDRRLKVLDDDDGTEVEKAHAMLLLGSKKCREVVRAYWFDGIPMRETCETKGLSWVQTSRGLAMHQENFRFEPLVDWHLAALRGHGATVNAALETVTEKYRPFFKAMILDGRDYEEALRCLLISTPEDHRDRLLSEQSKLPFPPQGSCDEAN